MQASIQTLRTYVGGANARVHETSQIPLHMIKMLGQETWIQMNFNSYLCERVVMNYQTGEIESSSLVLVNG